MPTGPNPAVQSTELRFQEGVSDKFWRVSVDGPEMTVTYGRVGAKGTTVIKTFASPDRARREADKLILEKQKKGYQEAG